VKFINFSSAQAYRSSNEPSDEEAPLYPADRATYYLVSKLAGEIYIEHLRRSGSLQAVTLRLGSCYGHGMASRSVVSIFMNKARSGETLQVYESNASLYDYVYIDDVTNVAVQAAVSGEPGVYNVGSGQSHSVLELAETVAATFPEHEVPIKVLSMPDRDPASFSPLSIEKTLRTWDFRPLNLQEGLKAFRQQMEST
jgi:nucleoside-diphosphate-sugar epimerase